MAKQLKNVYYFRKKVAKSILFFEAVLSIFLIIGIIIGVVDLARFLILLTSADVEQVFSRFYDFLDHLLLLIIGLELIIMLVKHNASSVVEVLIFAIAREILVRSPSMVEITIGILALAGVLAIKKYLLSEEYDDEYFGFILGAAVKIEDINNLMHINLPKSKANTLGGFVATLAKESKTRLNPGVVLRYKNIEFEILEIREGIIEKIRVVKTN